MDREQLRRRHLPHRDMPGAPYFVTTCLEGSVPARGLFELRRYRDVLLQRPKPENLTDDEWKSQCWKKSFVRLENWIDGEPARRVLENPDLAQIIVNALFHFAGERYDLLAFVVMPSHFHWLFQPLVPWVQSLPDSKRSPRERISHSINRFTATACKRVLNDQGRF
ncbi:MAG: hypothetical protein ACP5XB_18370 [Isosphaeraceae bacterium]